MVSSMAAGIESKFYTREVPLYGSLFCLDSAYVELATALLFCQYLYPVFLQLLIL